MSVTLNHTIVWCRNKRVSARYLTETLGLHDAKQWGPFMVVEMDNGVSLDFHDFHDPDGEITSQHYAFLLSEVEFDDVFSRLEASGQDYWADPGLSRTREINRNDGGRASTSRIPTGTSSKSSPSHMVRAK